MTLAALLTFFSVGLAILALARPVRRRSLAMFVPMGWIVASVCLSLLFLIWRDALLGVRPPFGWRQDVIVFLLSVGAFIVPVGAAVWAWISWHRAELTPKNADELEEVFRAAIRESEFDEIERIIRRNQERLTALPPRAASLLFSPKIVTSLIEADSMLHLELLSNFEFFESLDNPFGALDVVGRRLLSSTFSPLRSAVVARFGGFENLKYTQDEKALMERTFLSPVWYRDTRADYPLVISTVEVLARGKLDRSYNKVGRAYEASQGISTRAKCPVYLAEKTIVLAIEAAIEQHVEGDFYVSDLLDIFRAVQERSQFEKDIWESDLANSEFPTPYAYLLYEIADDLHSLSCSAVKSATAKKSPRDVEPPDRVAHDLALIWSFCVWNIADSETQVSPSFREGLIRQYLQFVLQLGWAPGEVYYGQGPANVKQLEPWRNLFAEELRERFAGEEGRRLASLQEAMDSLDRGKMYVFNGFDWLEQQLGS